MLPLLPLAAVLLSSPGQEAPAQAPAPRAPSGVEARDPARMPVFEFHSAFWSNLHHFLYREALELAAARDLAADGEAWRAAVGYYAERLVERDLLFDGGMRAIDLALGEVGGRADLAGVELEGELAFVLESVANVYRDALWPTHDAANQDWLRGVRPLLDEHLAGVAASLARHFGAPWPDAPIRVDLLAYSNWAGGYTSLGPDHIRIGTLFPGPASVAEAFELLVHEASHLAIGPIQERIAALSAGRGQRPPRALWHAILFYTVGEVVKASPATPADYVPYARAHGLATGPMALDYRALEAHWPAYLAREVELDEALVALLDALAGER